MMILDETKETIQEEDGGAENEPFLPLEGTTQWEEYQLGLRKGKWYSILEYTRWKERKKR